MKKLKIALTLGDPAGIGPELIVKMFLKHDLSKYGEVFVIGDIFPLLSAQRLISRKIAIRPMKDINDIKKEKFVINVLDAGNKDMDSIPMAAPGARAGRASFGYLKTAIQLAKIKKIDAIVTAPVNKHSLHMAGINYPGHTEILAKFTGTKKYAMMLSGEKLKVVLVTIHTALKNVPRLINKKNIFKIIDLTNKSLKNDFGIKAPRIAVLGLNPHAGEKGAFGKEEATKIIPAISAARKKYINVSGPFPSDTVFNKAVYEKKFDALVCMYHDQGLIPLKLLSFDTGVNITLGLPIVRTSPDHGTAYDLVCTGRASESSMMAALKMAAEIARNRKQR